MGETENNNINVNLSEKIAENNIQTQNFPENKLQNSETLKDKISNERLLGELLRYARTTSEMKFLMLLREIKSLSVSGKEVTIFADEEICEELSDEKYKSLLVKYFSKRELSLKISGPEKKDDLIEKLNRLCGGKLKIK